MHLTNLKIGLFVLKKEPLKINIEVFWVLLDYSNADISKTISNFLKMNHSWTYFEKFESYKIEFSALFSTLPIIFRKSKTVRYHSWCPQNDPQSRFPQQSEIRCSDISQKPRPSITAVRTAAMIHRISTPADTLAQPLLPAYSRDNSQQRPS